MKYWFLGLVCIAALIMCICIGYCKEPAKQVNNSDTIQKLQNEITALREKAAQYHPTFRDTVKEVVTRYRIRVDSVRVWLQANNSWESVCEKVGFENDSVGCRSILLQTYYRAQLQDTLIGIYQIQRTEDSLQIGVLMHLDSLNSELNTKHVSEQNRLKGEILRLDKENRTARLKGGLFGFVGGVLIGMFL